MAGEAPTTIILGQMGPEARNVVMKGSAGPTPEIRPEVQKRIDAMQKAEQETDPNVWRTRLVEAVEDLPDTSGNFLRAKDKFAFDGYGGNMEQLGKSGHLEFADIIEAEQRSTKVAIAESVIQDITRGFNGLDPTRQNEIVEFVTERFKTTKLGGEYLKKDPHADLKPVVKEMLQAGLTPEEIRGLHKDMVQWIDSANANLDPLHKEITAIKENIGTIQKQAIEVAEAIKKTEAEIQAKKAEHDDYTATTGKKYKEIERLTTDEEKRLTDIDTLPGEIEHLERQLEVHRSQLERATKSQGMDITQLAELATKAIAALKGTSPQQASPTAEAIVEAAMKKFSQGTPSSPEQKVTDLLSTIHEKKIALRKAEKTQQKLEDLRVKRDEYPKTIKEKEEQLQEYKNTETTIMSTMGVSAQQLAESFKKFAGFEERLTDTMDREIISRFLVRHNNVQMEKAIGRLETAMESVSEDQKQNLRKFLSRRWINIEGTPKERIRGILGKAGARTFEILIGKNNALDVKNWIKHRIAGQEFTTRLRESEIELDYQNALLRPGETGDTFENIDAILKQAYPDTEWNKIQKDTKQVEQLRATFALELTAIRYHATGKAPTALEQRIISTQPWSDELIKAGVIGNPEFVARMQEAVPEVTPEGVKTGDPKALTDVRKTTTRDRVLFLIMMGLSASQALSQVGKENNKQQAA